MWSLLHPCTAGTSGTRELSVALSEVDLLHRVREALPNLSPASRAVAEYILVNPDRAAFLNAVDLARSCGVSHASVIRFAQGLGFEGYPELQKGLQGRVSRKLTTVERMEELEEGGVQTLWERQMRMDTENIALTLRELDAGTCAEAAAQLADARTVYVIGLRSAASVATLAAFALRAVRPGAGVVMLSPTEYYEQLMGADERDVLLGFSFSRYFRLTLAIMQQARDLGTRCIAVTDSLASPLAQVAQITLPCRVAMNSFIESFVAPLSLVNALVTAVALKDRKATLARLASLEKTWQVNDIYYFKERRPRDEQHR